MAAVLVRAGDGGEQLTAERFHAVASGLLGAGEDRGLQAGQRGHDQADPARRVGVQPDHSRPDGGEGACEDGAGHGEGNDLDGGDHLAGGDGGPVGQGCEGERLIDGVEGVHGRRVDAEQAGCVGEQVDPARAGARAVEPRRQ